MAPSLENVLVFDEVYQMIYEAHLHDLGVSVLSRHLQMINVQILSKSQNGPLRYGVKNTTITMLYIAKEGFY